MAKNLFLEGEILAPKKGRNLFAEGEMLAPKKQPSRQQQIWDMQAKLTPQEALVSELMSGVQGANTSFANRPHGIMQPILEGEIGKKYIDPLANFLRTNAKKYLPENLKPKYEGMPIAEASRNVAKQRESDYKAEYELNPLSTIGGFGFGEIGQNLPAAYAGFGGLIPAFGRGAIGSTFGGALGGALGGASQYINPGESRALNSILGAGTGLLTGGLMGGGYQVGRSYPASKVSKRINERGLANEAHYGEKLYPEFFKDVEKASVGHVTPPDLNYGQLMQDNPGDLAEVFRNFLGKQTPRKAHLLQSDIGKEVARLERKSVTSGLNSIENANLQSLRRADVSVNDALSQALERGNPELAKRYSDITKGYKRDVIPYTRSSAINKFRNDELGNREFLKKLTKEEKFMTQVGREHHPELNARKYLPYAVGSGVGYYNKDKILNLINAFGGNND